MIISFIKIFPDCHELNQALHTEGHRIEDLRAEVTEDAEADSDLTIQPENFQKKMIQFSGVYFKGENYEF